MTYMVQLLPVGNGRALWAASSRGGEWVADWRLGDDFEMSDAIRLARRVATDNPAAEVWIQRSDGRAKRIKPATMRARS